MQRHNFPAGFLVACLSLAICGVSQAQALWKYTDKDGKVTYSDKAPKKGETATPVTSDSSTNMIEAPKNLRQGVPQKLQDVWRVCIAGFGPRFPSARRLRRFGL